MVRPGTTTKSAWLIALDTIDVANALAAETSVRGLGGHPATRRPTWRIQNRSGNRFG
jgi:hypothetical protein